MSFSNRRVRYGSPVGVIILGVLFAAADTASLGNTVATVAIAGGLIWLMILVGRDLGMGEHGSRRRPLPVPPRDGEDPGPDPPA